MKIATASRLALRQTWKVVAVIVLNLFHPHHFMGLKNAVARRLVKALGPGATVSPGFFAFHGFNVVAGMSCSFGYRFQIFDFAPVFIGNRLLASHGVTLIAGTHDTDATRTYRPGPITIGNNVWIGANVLIVGPCEIGDDCIIGANSYVSGQFGAGSRIGGSPARLLSSSHP